MRQPHFIKPNEQCRTPKRIIALACESKTTKKGTGYVATFASGSVVEAKRNDAGTWSEPIHLVFDDPADLWEEIVSYTRVRARTWLCCHRAGDTLRIAQAFRYLPRLGWTANPDVIVTDTTLSVGWHDPSGRSLLVVDLFSYLPADLPKVRKMTTTDDDALAIFTAFSDLVALQHNYDLGNFARTGASNASNHFRHAHMRDRIYIHDDAKALEAERASIFTGRTEAWRWGTHRHLDEWDLPLAYPRVGLDAPLPVRLLGIRPGGSPITRGQLGLVHAFVDCEVPVLPARGENGRLSWPRGRLEGWYWQPELDLAEEHGAQIFPIEQYVYEAHSVLREWAEWIIATQSPNNPLTPTQRFAAKHWGRALIGKFGARNADWRSDATFTGCDLELSKEVDDRFGIGERLTIGGRSLVSFEKTYGDNAFPALMSRVVSECRMRLWRLMCVAGLQNVAYVDTDSLFTNSEGSDQLRAFTESGAGWGLRVKAHHDKVTILGPRQLILRDGPRVSGLPKVATRAGTNEAYVAQMTEGFRSGAGGGQVTEVVSKERTFRLKPHDNRRRHLPGGLTEAMPA